MQRESLSAQSWSTNRAGIFRERYRDENVMEDSIASFRGGLLRRLLAIPVAGTPVPTRCVHQPIHDAAFARAIPCRTQRTKITQLRFEELKLLSSSMHPDQMSINHGIDLATGHVARVHQREQPPYVPQRDVQRAAMANERQSFDGLPPVSTIAVGRLGRRWQQVLAFVITNRSGVCVRQTGEFSYLHIVLTLKRLQGFQ